MVMLLCGFTSLWAAQKVTVAEGITGGTVTVDKAAPAAGETVTITVTPDAGYYIAKSDIVAEATINPGMAQVPALKAAGPNVGMKIDLNGEEPARLSQEATYTFVMPEEPYDVLITATFHAQDAYTITIAPGIENGTVTADKSEAFEGDEVTLTITPAVGYELDELKVMAGNDEVTVTDGKFTMPAANVTVTATFKAIDYTITIVDAENGVVEADKATAHVGDEVSLTITPSEGYELDELKVMAGNDEVTVTDGKFTMPAANVTVTATFKKVINYNFVTYNNPEHATVVVTVDGEEIPSLTQVAEDKNVVVTVTVDEGYVIDNVKIVGNQLIREKDDDPFGGEFGAPALKDEPTPFDVDYTVEGNVYTFIMPNADVAITVTVKEVEHTYTVAGEPASVFGSNDPWDPTSTAGDMTLGDDGVYTWTSQPTYLEGDIALKVVQDHSWDVNYPNDNYVVSGLKPGTYTITVTFNPATGEVNVVVNGMMDIYVFGEVNGSNYATNSGVKMESEDGKTYTASVTIDGTLNGYNYFDFTHKLVDAADAWDDIAAYRFGAVADGAFLVNGPQMNKALSLTYDGELHSFQIPAGEYTLTLDAEAMTLTIAGGTKLAYILQNGVEGVDYTVIDDLKVMDKESVNNRLFVSDGQNNWIMLNAGDFYATASGKDALKGGYISGAFAGKTLNPYLALTTDPAEYEDGELLPELEAATYKLSETFAPIIDEVINVSRAYYKESDGALRAYAPSNAIQGQSLTLDNSIINFNFEDGKRYDVYGVINIKEPWKTAAPSLLDYDYNFQNYVLIVLKAEGVPSPTAIDDITAAQGVKSVKFFNMTGVESSTPFPGVNIVVKEMNDGSKVVVKQQF